MKMFKKAAALVMAAVLAVGMLAGCGGKSYGTPEEEVLKKINEARTSMKGNLTPLSNDSALSAAAAKLLEEFEKTPAETTYGTGYSMTGSQITQTLSTVAQGKTVYACNQQDTTNYYSLSAGIYVAPVVSGQYTYPTTSQSVGSSTCYLTRPAVASDVGGQGEQCMNGVYGYSLAIRNKVKVGIATREIKGTLYLMVLYDLAA